MPVIGSEPGKQSFAARLFRRSLAGFFLVLLLGSSAKPVRAQIIRIEVVNGKTGRPLAGTCVNVWVGSQRKAAMAIPTDAGGVASLRLAGKDDEISTRNQWKECGLFGVIHPVVKYADSMRINVGYVSCQPHRPDYSWLGKLDFSTKEVLESGVVTPNACGKAKASPEPGEVILFVRPLSWWEKLKE